MSKINVLDSSVYNLISAGEVIEGPRSIVKELIENSIDAGATSLSVSIENGGIKRLEIIDNGCGMDAEDLKKAILPHATSKLSSAVDLSTISTLGFRGEALASVAAISEIEIKSKCFESLTANRILVKGGEVIDFQPTSLSLGTSITINNLFYNTPVRFKFLQSPKTEERKITNLLSDMILSNPFVSFKYTVNGKVVFSTFGKGLGEAINAVLPSSTVDNLLFFEHNEEKYRLYGYIAIPNTEAIKPSRKQQTLIVNGRVIADKTISAVVCNAYGGSLMKNSYPSYIIDVVLPFDEVDINVHPSKNEVRFSKDCAINAIIYRAIKEALFRFDKDAINEVFSDIVSHSERKDLNAVVEDISEQKNVAKSSNSLFPDSTSQASYGTDHASDFKITKPIPPIYIFSDNVKPFSNVIDKEEEIQPTQEKKESIPSDESSSKPTIISKITTEGIEQTKIADISQKINYKVVGQAFGTYILFETENNLYFIDQHAANERVLFDRLIAQYEKKRIDVQYMLLPFVYEISEKEMLFFNTYKEEFASLGFEIDEFGRNSIKISAVPLLLEDINLEVFVAQLLNEAANGSKKELSNVQIVREKIAMCACKGAIKGNTELSSEDLDAFVKSFIESGMPRQCPHGRPTMLTFTKKEIEKLFRRIV